MLLELKRIQVPLGQRVLLQDVTWQEFEAILEELGEQRSTRIAFNNGVLEIMTPLPEHEASKEIIGDLVKALLEELNIEFLSLGSTTFKQAEMMKGIEPDQCFYIQNKAAVRGKIRIDLTIDPPPDLVLEIDITSRTHPSIYEALRVPELWRFERGTLEIYVWKEGKYTESKVSLVLPMLNLLEVISIYLQQSRIEGRNSAMRAFRTWVRKELAKQS